MITNTYIGRNAQNFEKQPSVTVDRVIVKVDDENNYYSPSGLTQAQWDAMTGKIVTVSIPFGTQAMADSIRTTLSSKAFLPYKATFAELDPAAELGDWVTADGIYSVIAKRTFNLNSLGSSEVSAETENEVTDKYPYLSKAEAEVQMSLAGFSSRLSVAEDSIDAEVIARQNADDALSDEIEDRVPYTELSTKIGQYIDTSAGTSQIISACSGTYLTQTDASNTYTTITRTANIEQSVTADEAKIALVVQSSGGTNSIKAASIVAAINDAGSSVVIDADHIDISGCVTFSDLSTAGQTTINGGNITTGTINAQRVGAGTFEMDYGYVGEGRGNDGSGTTYGVILSSSNSGSTGLGTGDYYFIATNSGARMTGGDSYVYCTDDGVTLCGENGYDIYIQSSALTPSRNNSVQLGYSNYAWTVGYSYSWAEVSDRDKKENIDYDVSAYEALFDKLKPCKFNYISEDETKLVKTGFIAQDIEQAMTEIGMPMKDFDGLRFDYDEATGTKSNYSLCYNDIMCLVVNEVQKLKAKVSQLEANLN